MRWPKGHGNLGDSWPAFTNAAQKKGCGAFAFAEGDDDQLRQLLYNEAPNVERLSQSFTSTLTMALQSSPVSVNAARKKGRGAFAFAEGEDEQLRQLLYNEAPNVERLSQSFTSGSYNGLAIVTCHPSA